MVKRWLEAIRLRLRPFRTDKDIENEMLAHVELEVDEQRSAGVSNEEARRRARLALGGTRAAIEKIRDREWITFAEGWARDLVYAVRTLRRAPLFFITAVLTLALGMGGSTAVFSFLYGLVLRPIPTQEPAALMQLGLVRSADPQGAVNTFVTYRMLKLLQRDSTSFSEISGWSRYYAFVGDRGGSIRRHMAALVTGNAFTAVLMRPQVGRLLAPFDDVPGGSPQGWPVVLSYRYWREELGSDPDVVGKLLRIAGTPAEFRGVWPGDYVEMYLPMQFFNVVTKKDMLESPKSDFRFPAIGRLRPGVSAARAGAEIARLKEQMIAEVIPVGKQHDAMAERTYAQATSARTGLPNYITRTYAKPLVLTSVNTQKRP